MPRPFSFRGQHGGREDKGRVYAAAHAELDHRPDLCRCSPNPVTSPLGCASRLIVAARARTASGGPAGRRHHRPGRKHRNEGVWNGSRWRRPRFRSAASGEARRAAVGDPAKGHAGLASDPVGCHRDRARDRNCGRSGRYGADAALARVCCAVQRHQQNEARKHGDSPAQHGQPKPAAPDLRVVRVFAGRKVSDSNRRGLEGHLDDASI